MTPPLVPTYEVGPTGSPSGPVIETRAAQHVDVPIRTSLNRMLIRSPACPENTSSAFWPGSVVATVTGGPPGGIVGGKAPCAPAAAGLFPPGARARVLPG